jgi:hypothetical protein
MECEIKNRPELHCNGKCYLAKQLQKADNLLDERREESSKSLVNLKWMETSLFACPETIVMKLDQSTISLNETSNFNVVNFYHFENSLSCFHPPCA